MISLLVEAIRKKEMRTVLGIDYDMDSLVGVQLKKQDGEFSLLCCDSTFFDENSYYEGELIADCIGDRISKIIKSNKLSAFTSLGFTTYRDINVSRVVIECDRRILEIVEKQDISFYLKEHYFKKKYPNDYVNVAFYYDDEIDDARRIVVYYIFDFKYLDRMKKIAKRAKKYVDVCTLDNFALTNFVNILYKEELKREKSEVFFLGLYADKICLYGFSPDGELRSFEVMKIFKDDLEDSKYIDEAVNLLLRFIDISLLDYYEGSDDDIEESNNKVYMFGLKDNMHDIQKSIAELSNKDCQLINPFKNIDIANTEITEPYRYLMAIAISLWDMK